MSPMSDLGPFEPLWATVTHWSDVRFVLHARSTVWPAADVSQKFLCARRACVSVSRSRCVECGRLARCAVRGREPHYRTSSTRSVTSASTPSASTSAQSNVRLRHAFRFLIASLPPCRGAPGASAVVPGDGERRSVAVATRLSERSVATRHRHGERSAKCSVATARRLSVCSANFSADSRHFSAALRPHFRSNGPGWGSLMATLGGLPPPCRRRRVRAVLAA